MKYYPFQIITFTDHHHINDTWVKPENLKPQSVVLQYVGWVVKEDKQCVMLAQGRDLAAEHREYDSFMTILKPCIVSRSTINNKKELR